MTPVRFSKRVLQSLRRRAREKMFEAYVRWMGIAGARGVTTPVRFAANELFLRKTTGQYTIRRTGRTLFVRHPVADAPVVYEVMHGPSYVPPRNVEQRILSLEKPRIVDLGAHVGTCTLGLLDRFPKAHVVAFEPQPETAALLRRMIDANGLGDRCDVRQAAAGTAPDTATMEGSSALAHLTRKSKDVQEAVDLMPPLAKYQELGVLTEVDVVDVLPVLAGADLVKMDIEGAEWPILADPRFADLGIGAISLEYHPQGAPQTDTLGAVTSILQAAGFVVDAPVVDFGANGVVWAWRP